MSTFVFAEGLSIHVTHLKQDICIPKKFIHTDEDGDKFLDLKPERWRDIGTLLTSFLNAEDRTGKEARQLFRTKNGKGVNFLKWMKRHRDNAVRSKFKINSDVRLTSRMFKSRAEQIATDTLSVPMPQVGDDVPVAVIEHRLVKRQKALSVKIDDDTFTYIGKAFRYFLMNPSAPTFDLESASSSDNDESKDEAPDVNDEGESDGEGEADVDPDDADNRTLAQLVPRTSSNVVRSSPLFKAFQKAADTV